MEPRDGQAAATGRGLRRNARRGARASRPTRRTGGRGTGTMLPGGHDPAGRMESRGSWPGLAGEVRGQGHRALRATSAPLDSTPNVVAVTYVGPHQSGGDVNIAAQVSRRQRLAVGLRSSDGRRGTGSGDGQRD